MTKRIFIGVCNSQDFVPAEFFWSMLGQVDFVAKPEFGRAKHPWDVCRNNQLIDGFLNSGCDYFAKTDIDQKYPVDYFKTLVPLVDQYKVIGPVIYDRWRGPGFIPLAFRNKMITRENMFPLPRDGSIVDVPYSHTNLIYAREVLEKIPRPWYEAYATDDGLGRKNHVDYTFLDKIRNAGYPIYIHTGVVVGHLATQPIDQEFYDTWHRGHKEVL